MFEIRRAIEGGGDGDDGAEPARAAQPRPVISAAHAGLQNSRLAAKGARTGKK